MRFIHLADVHLGAVPDRGCPWSKEREEEIWSTFRRVIAGIREDPVDLLFISGDLFHRQPLMRELKEVNYLFSTIPDTRVYLMAGNHDFISRDSFYNTFEWNSNVIFFRSRELTCVKDPRLDVYVYGLSYYDREIKDGLYDQAVPVQKEGIHILLAHGGDEKHIPLSAAALAASGFDYVALGHLHGPQKIKEEWIRYAGSPLKYSVSEERHHKSITMVTLGEKGEKTEIRQIPLNPRQDVRTERGTLKEILERATEANRHDFISVTLTDENEPYRMKEMLREVYDYLLEIRVDNTRTRKRLELTLETQENLTPFEAFRAFYEDVAKMPLTGAEEALLEKTLNQLTEDKE